MLEKKRAKIKNPYAVDSGHLRQLSIEEVEASLRQLSANLPSAAPGAGQADSGTAPNNAYVSCKIELLIIVLHNVVGLTMQYLKRLKICMSSKLKV